MRVKSILKTMGLLIGTAVVCSAVTFGVVELSKRAPKDLQFVQAVASPVDGKIVFAKGKEYIPVPTEINFINDDNKVEKINQSTLLDYLYTSKVEYAINKDKMYVKKTQGMPSYKNIIVKETYDHGNSYESHFQVYYDDYSDYSGKTPDTFYLSTSLGEVISGKDAVAQYGEDFLKDPKGFGFVPGNVKIVKGRTNIIFYHEVLFPDSPTVRNYDNIQKKFIEYFRLDKYVQP